MSKQLFVDFELPRYMFEEANEVIRRDFPEWLVNYMDRPNSVAPVRLLWAGWLFLKYQENYMANHEGRFVGVTYEDYTAMDDPFAIQSVMLTSEYKDAMERMSRLYPDVYYNKAKDNNYYLARLGWACLRELHDQTLLLSYDKELANKLAEGSEVAELNYVWLSDNPKRPVNTELRKGDVIQ